MTDATELMPPFDGPRSNPTLFGIAEGLSALFPVTERADDSARAATGVGCVERDDDAERARAA